MKASTLAVRCVLLGLLLAALAPAATAVIIVYDNDLDFSDANNPSGTWSYQEGNSLLPHFTPVPHPQLAPAAANGYWGASSASLNTSMLLTTASGSATGLWSDNDFLAADMLVRTTDPNTGGPTVLAWTAPSAGYFTYSGAIWYADAPSGPFGNDFSLSLNNAPPIETGTASMGQDRTNGVNLNNGLLPIPVAAGDVFALALTPTITSPVGSLAGVVLTIDFVPIPEPGTIALAFCGGLLLLGAARRRSTARRQRAC